MIIPSAKWFKGALAQLGHDYDRVISTRCDCCERRTALGDLVSGDDGESWECPECRAEQQLTEAEEEHEVFEEDMTLGEFVQGRSLGASVEDAGPTMNDMENVPPPATLDDIAAILGDIHDLLAPHYSSPAAPVSAGGSPTTTGRVGDSPEGIDGTPLQPLPSGLPTSLLLNHAADIIAGYADETGSIQLGELIPELRARARTFKAIEKQQLS